MSISLREKPTKVKQVSTAMLRLKIRTQATTKVIDVDPSTHIGSFLISFVRHIGYPLQDFAGSPLSYRLRLSSGPMLPHNMSFAALQLEPGSILVLDIPTVETVTIPVGNASSSGGVRENTNPLKRPWTRRSVILAGIYTAVGSTGFMSGAATAILQHASAATNKTAATTLRPVMPTLPTSATIQFTFAQHQKLVRSISWSPNGLLASGSDDAKVLIWSNDGTVQQQLQHQAPVRALAWSPDNQFIATGSANQVSFWQATTGTLQTQANNPHTGLVTSIAWASHGDMQVVSGGLDMRAVVWDTTNANYQAQTIFTKHTTAIEATAFDAAGQIIATASQGGLVRVWRATDGQEIHGYYQPAQVPMRAIAFSPMQQNLVLGGDDGLIRLWTSGLVCSQQVQGNFGTQCTQVPQILKAHSKPVRAIAWSPSGRFLATGGEDGRLAVWNAQQSQAPLFITQVAGTIRSLAWEMTDALLASASGNTVTIWALH